MEEWKNIKSFENLYQVSNYGRVRSIDRIIKRVKDGVLTDFRFKGKLLTPKLNKRTGYAHVALSINSKRKYVNIHRLVAESFIRVLSGKRKSTHGYYFEYETVKEE